MVHESHDPKPVFIISDGTGDTAFKVVRACLLQFGGVPVALHTFPQVTDAEHLRRLFRRAADMQAMVVTTLVRGEQRKEAERLAQKYRLAFVDVVGALLGSMSDYLRVPPQGMPGLMYRTDQSYYRRIAAVEYTVKADDGKEPRMLPEADIVLVGVSRTSKTPLSIYLAHKGYKVGNVPIVLDRPPPEYLFDVDPRRIFGLTIDPQKLVGIRSKRVEQMRMSDRTNYCQLDYVLAELDFAHDLFSRNREWPIIDVTEKAVEETAAVILKVLEERGLANTIGEAGQI